MTGLNSGQWSDVGINNSVKRFLLPHFEHMLRIIYVLRYICGKFPEIYFKIALISFDCNLKIRNLCKLFKTRPRSVMAKLRMMLELFHYCDVIMGVMASQIIGVSIVCSIVSSGSASLAFVRGFHRWPVNSPHKGSNAENVSISWRHHVDKLQLWFHLLIFLFIKWY